MDSLVWLTKYLEDVGEVSIWAAVILLVIAVISASISP